MKTLTEIKLNNLLLEREYAIASGNKIRLAYIDAQIKLCNNILHEKAVNGKVAHG